MNSSFCAFVMLLAATVAAAAPQSIPPDKPKVREGKVGAAVDKAIAAAENVLREEKTGNNVVAAKDAHLVHHAAALLIASGRDDEALNWLQAAVRLAPNQLDWQWTLSQLYARKGDAKKAESLARLVWERAETETLLEESAAFLKEKPAWDVPLLKDAPAGTEVVGIILIGPVDRWLVKAAAQSMEKRLGYPVRLATPRLDLGEPHRTSARLVAKEAAELLNWDQPAVLDTMEELGIESRETATEKDILKLLATLMMAAGRTDMAIDWLKAYAEQSAQSQWQGEKLFNQLVAERMDGHSAKIVSWVALTEGDIYSGDTNYVFALQSNSPPIALVSAARFRSSFWKTAPDRARLQARLEKQLVSSFGQVLGVPRCADPRCVRAYPSSLDEFDAKGSIYCEECREGVEKVIGRKLP